MDPTERNLKVAELCISGFTFLVALGVAIVGYCDFASKQAELLKAQQDSVKAQQQEVRKTLHDSQLNLCEEVATAASSVFDAPNEPELRQRLEGFERLKHGKALTLLEPAVLNAMIDFDTEALNFDRGLNTKPTNSGAFQTKARCTLGAKGFALVHACRTMLSKAFQQDSGGGIAPLDDSYNIGFICTTSPETASPGRSKPLKGGAYPGKSPSPAPSVSSPARKTE